ncbi:hypothetical protein ACFV2D_35970 [Streptomyces capillispiralis]|uniref:hypothetical protein n=1 Tax=Streptomyces capillispiralis TaxID=68182 RepID=UPI0036C88E0E
MPTEIGTARDVPGGQQPLGRARQQSLPGWWKTDAFTEPRDVPPLPRPADQPRRNTSGGDVTVYRSGVAGLDAVPRRRDERSYELGQQSLTEWWKTSAFTEPRDVPPLPRPADQPRLNTAGRDVTLNRSAVAGLDAVPGSKEEGSYELGLRKALEAMQEKEAENRKKAAEPFVNFEDHRKSGESHKEGEESHKERVSAYKRALRTVAAPFMKPTNPTSASRNPPPSQARAATRRR